MSKRKIKFIVLVGSSGTGKGSIVKKLLSRIPALAQIKGYTTRQPRSRQDAQKYNFINEQKFRALLEKGEIIEWTKQAGVYYGTSAKSLAEILKTDKIGIRDADIRLAKRLKELYPERTLAIYVTAPSRYLALRLKKRGLDDKEAIAKRIIQARDVASQIEQSSDILDYRIVNKQNQLEKTVEKISQFINSNEH